MVMDTLQAIKDKMGLSSSKRLTTFFVVFFIVVPVVLTATLMYRNSSFALFEGFSEGKVPGGEAGDQNVTTDLLTERSNNTTNGSGLGGSVQNTTHDNSGGTDKNKTVSEVQVLHGEIENGTHPVEGRTAARNITVSEVGLKNATLTSSTNDSTSHTTINPDDKHKLLDGLLDSGFNEASCISRLQSHSYRKASPHKPSPYLISKLRNYEQLHRRCGPNTRAYNKSVIKIIHSKKNVAAATMCKYIVWTPANGLGNQMISIVATFLYAVLTDRVLLVRFGEEMHGLFCEPFLNSTWILPKHSPFWNEDHVQKYQTILEKDRANKNSKEHQHLPSALFLNMQHTSNDPEKYFHCNHSQDLLKNVPLLILQSDQYFVPSLFMNPSFNLEVTKMFPEKDTVFHHLGRYLFHPSNEAWGLISRFYQVYLAKADEKIGLQIRLFNPKTTPKEAVMDLLLNCTIQNKLLPAVLDMQNSVSDYTLKNQTSVKAVLVTSLYPEYGENLKTMYLNKPTVSGELVGVYQPSHEEHQKFHDTKHNMKAWTEMYLLSLSDVLVTTSLSTFGYVAQGLGGLKPWLLFKLTTNETHFPACQRDFSLEPCYHIPPKHYCNGNPIKGFASSFPYLRECKDFIYGVKLVSGST